MADKHNRLDSQFSIVSAFWGPLMPEHVLTGTLTNDDGELYKITITVERHSL